MPHELIRKLVLASVLVAMATLAGCSSLESLPIGTGSGTNDLKTSRCACIPVLQEFEPGWREDLARRLGAG